MLPILQTKNVNYTFTLTPQHQYYPYYMLSQSVTIGSNHQPITINFDQMIFSLSYIPSRSCTQCTNAVYTCNPNDTTCRNESPYSFTLQNNLFSGEGMYTYDEMQLNGTQVPLTFLSVNSIDSSNIPASLIIEGTFVLFWFRTYLPNQFPVILDLWTLCYLHRLFHTILSWGWTIAS